MSPRLATAVKQNDHAAFVGDTFRGEQAENFEDVNRSRAESAKLSLRSVEIAR